MGVFSAGLRSGTVKVEKVDDYTVSFTFPFVTPTAIEMLSQIFIMPEHIYKDVTDFEHNDYNMNSVGRSSTNW